MMFGQSQIDHFVDCKLWATNRYMMLCYDSKVFYLYS